MSSSSYLYIQIFAYSNSGLPLFSFPSGSSSGGVPLCPTHLILLFFCRSLFCFFLQVIADQVRPVSLQNVR